MKHYYQSLNKVNTISTKTQLWEDSKHLKAVQLFMFKLFYNLLYYLVFDKKIGLTQCTFFTYLYKTKLHFWSWFGVAFILVP